MPLAAVEDLADVGAVSQDLADLAARPRRLRIGVLHAFAQQALADHVDRAVLVSVQIEFVARPRTPAGSAMLPRRCDRHRVDEEGKREVVE